MISLPANVPCNPALTTADGLSMRKILLLLTGLTILLGQPLQAEIYRVVDEEGNVSFTDQPGPDKSAEATSVDVDDESNISDSPRTIRENEPSWVKEAREERERKASEEDADKEDEEELDEKEQWKLDVKEARQAVKDARKNLEQGREPGEGDYIGFRSPTGAKGARPSSEYLERVEALEKDLQDAEQRLKKLLRNKP